MKQKFYKKVTEKGMNFASRQIMKAFQNFFGFSHDSELEAKLWPCRHQIEYYLSDLNLETDKVFREQIEADPNRYISINFIMDCPRIKKLNLTPDDICDIAESSPFLEVDPIRTNYRIRSVKPFVSDPRRQFRSIRVSGINNDAPDHLQRKFFESMFSDIRAIHPYYKLDDNQLVYSGTTIVELGSEKEAKKAVDNGIEFDGGLLDVILVSDFEEKMKEQKKQKNEEKEKSPRKYKRN